MWGFSTNFNVCWMKFSPMFETLIFYNIFT